MPLKVTVLVPLVAPKLAPVIVTDVPTGPLVGARVVMLGAGPTTVKPTPLLATTSDGDDDVAGHRARGHRYDDARGRPGRRRGDGVPLKVTVLVPWVAPKLVPVIVTDVPTGPLVGDRVVMLGAGPTTVNATPLLATPPTVTTTFPVVAPAGTGTTMLVADHVVGVADRAVEGDGTGPLRRAEVGAGDRHRRADRPARRGPGRDARRRSDHREADAVAGDATDGDDDVPGRRAAGTGTTMLVADQVVGVATVPLKRDRTASPCVAPKFVPVIVTDRPDRPARRRPGS